MRLFHVDTFTSRALAGAAAPVIVSDEPLELERAFALAGEFNQPVLTSLRPTALGCDVRYFEKAREVGHVGHAGLAAAYVAFNRIYPHRIRIALGNTIDGEMHAERDGDHVVLDLSPTPAVHAESVDNLDAALGHVPIRDRLRSDFGSVAVLEDERAVRGVRPDYVKALQVPGSTIIVTAPGQTADFVSRVFAPKENLLEDPVCGTAHRILVPYWASKLGRTRLTAHQVSSREGHFQCSLENGRVRLGGKAVVLYEAELAL